MDEERRGGEVGRSFDKETNGPLVLWYSWLVFSFRTFFVKTSSRQATRRTLPPGNCLTAGRPPRALILFFF